MIRKVWPLAVAAVSLGIDAYVLAGVLPRIANSLTSTVSMIGLGVTTFTAAYAVAGPLLSGRLARGSTARALLIALGLFNLGNLVTTVAPGIEVFLASRVVAGVGAGILTAVATATAAAMVADHERGRAMSLVTFGLSAGTVAGVPVGMIIGQSAGWRWTMALVVLIGVVSMAALALRAKTLPRLEAAAGGSAFTVLRSSRTSVGIMAAFLLGVASLGLYTYLLPMAEDRGLGGLGFALVWAWGIGGVTGSALIGKPLDRYGPKKLLVTLPALLAMSFAAAWLSSSPIVWLIAAAVWGAAGWASVPTLQQTLTAHRPAQAMPIIAFQMAAMYLGSAVGAALGGALLTAGTGPADLAAWALAPAVLAVALTSWIATRAPARQASEPAQTAACESAA
ncbi:MFS transporter [Streptomyces anulatus]|uniref:MFS transporter n=1 Tax=Streptomyces anulatus TaxID=1892 RepID=UPI002F9123F8|nr:MFS transporter [Streptomyces anulatus]